MILWGGGIWNWFDPLSLIKAMKLVHQKRPHIKLVFMGVIPPDPHLPTTLMARQAIALAKELEAFNQYVFFNEEWVPYEERQNFLLEADMGVSTHFDHLETHFSFRTRILDYLWATLPILATQGDSFAELIERHRLGVIVPYGNVQVIADAIVNVFDHPQQLEQIKHNLLNIREQFHWTSVTAPLRQMIVQLLNDSSSRSKWSDGKILLHFMFTKIRERGIRSCLQQYLFRKNPHCQTHEK